MSRRLGKPKRPTPWVCTVLLFESFPRQSGLEDFANRKKDQEETGTRLRDSKTKLRSSIRACRPPISRPRLKLFRPG